MNGYLFLTKIAQIQNQIKNCPSGKKDPTCINLPQTPAGSNQLQTVLSIAFGIIGAVALIYIIIAGLKFITSQGNAEKVAQARQTIIYAGIGLAIIGVAEAIVIFVLGSL